MTKLFRNIEKPESKEYQREGEKGIIKTRERAEQDEGKKRASVGERGRENWRLEWQRERGGDKNELGEGRTGIQI